MIGASPPPYHGSIDDVLVADAVAAAGAVPARPPRYQRPPRSGKHRPPRSRERPPGHPPRACLLPHAQGRAAGSGLRAPGHDAPWLLARLPLPPDGPRRAARPPPTSSTPTAGTGTTSTARRPRPCAPTSAGCCAEIDAAVVHSEALIPMFEGLVPRGADLARLQRHRRRSGGSARGSPGRLHPEPAAGRRPCSTWAICTRRKAFWIS